MYREGSGAPLIAATGEVVTRRKPVMSHVNQLDYVHKSNDQLMTNNRHNDILDSFMDGNNYFQGNLGGLNNVNQKNQDIENENDQSKSSLNVLNQGCKCHPLQRVSLVRPMAPLRRGVNLQVCLIN